MPSMDLDVRLVDDGQCFRLLTMYNSGRYEAAGVAAFISMIAGIAARIGEDQLASV